MTSSNDFKVSLVSKNAYESLLKYCSTQENLLNIYLNRVIPILHYLEEQHYKTNIHDDNIDIFKTIGFVPKKIDNKSQFFTQKMEDLSAEMKNNYRIDQFDLYHIKLKFYRANNRYLSFNLIEIVSSRKIVSNTALKSHLLFYKNQLFQLLGIEIDIQNDLEYLNKSSENHNLLV